MENIKQKFILLQQTGQFTMTELRRQFGICPDTGGYRKSHSGGARPETSEKVAQAFGFLPATGTAGVFPSTSELYAVPRNAISLEVMALPIK